MSSTKISKDYQDGYDLGYKNGYVDGAKDFQPKKGKWMHIVEEDNDVECPFCGFQEDGVYYNFCPKCGADMRSEQNFSYADNDTAQGGLASAT